MIKFKIGEILQITTKNSIDIVRTDKSKITNISNNIIFTEDVESDIKYKINCNTNTIQCEYGKGFSIDYDIIKIKKVG